MPREIAQWVSVISATLPSRRSTRVENPALERIAIWDFDGHHGNGTEAIVAHNERIRFASIHQFPAYPGTGAKSFANIDNYPIAPYTPREAILDIARRSLDKLIAFEPDLLLVSAGFDAYARDPLLQLTLEREDFATFGEWLNEIDIPVAVVLEGGYSNDLPELIDAFLTAWQLAPQIYTHQTQTTFLESVNIVSYWVAFTARIQFCGRVLIFLIPVLPCSGFRREQPAPMHIFEVAVRKLVSSLRILWEATIDA